MKKMIVLTAVASLTVTLSVLCIIFYTKHQKAQARIVNIPSITLQTLEGQTADIAQITCDNVSVIFFFHPECIFCEMEIKEILAHQNGLVGVNIVFITTAENGELAKFLNEYPIGTIPNSAVLIDHDREFVITYNVKSPPTCYVYDEEQKLRKTIRGTVSVSDLTKIIHDLK
jgi:thiol-disulfide isomerase/thioredoxin